MSAILIEEINQMVLAIVAQLVENPNSITVVSFEGAVAAVIEIRVPKAQRGRVIGTGGKTIEAIRLLTRAAGSRVGIRCLVEVPE